MGKRRTLWVGIVAGIGFLIMIFDAQTALYGARDGISLCINCVIPSLFPFFVLSALINSSFFGRDIRLLKPIGKACRTPKGAESILLLGLLGGYPIGAKSIDEAYRNGEINHKDAKRMLGFCNNAGPAFIFGVVGTLFESKAVPWCLWGIQILSAVVVGYLLPNKQSDISSLQKTQELSLVKALENSLKSICTVCGWVVIFRVIIIFCQRWFLWLLPQWLQAGFIGMLELTNGCYALLDIESNSLRFVLCAGMLGFGGCCVAMQTASVTSGVGFGYYFPGKLLQTALCIIFASALQFVLFSEFEIAPIYVALLILIISLFVVSLHLCRKKVVAFCR